MVGKQAGKETGHMPERKYVAFFSMSVYYSLKLAQLSDM
jgi:hypothetical protein